MVKEATLKHESLHASKAMTLPNKTPYHEVTLLLDKECTKKAFFRCYQTEIVEYLLHQGAYVDAREETHNLVAKSSRVDLKIPPQYLQVRFYDTFVKIALLK